MLTHSSFLLSLVTIAFFPHLQTKPYCYLVFLRFSPLGQKEPKLGSQYKACELLKNVGFSPDMGSALQLQSIIPNEIHWSCLHPMRDSSYKWSRKTRRKKDKTFTKIYLDICRKMTWMLTAPSSETDADLSPIANSDIFFQLLSFKSLIISKSSPLQKTYAVQVGT